MIEVCNLDCEYCLFSLAYTSINVYVFISEIVQPLTLGR